jgi:hypothetical protein
MIRGLQAGRAKPMPTIPKPVTPDYLARPIEAAFAPYRLYAQAFATAQEAGSLWVRSWLHACEGARTLALQQMQIAQGIGGALRAAQPPGANDAGSEAPAPGVPWPLGRIAAAAARAAHAFDQDPRWTAQPPADPHPPH